MKEADKIFSIYASSFFYGIYSIPDGTECKPVFRWNKMETPYNLYIARDTLFTDILYKISLSDTFYQPSVELPLGKIYWKVECGEKDTILLGKSSFFLYSSDTAMVPNDYSTISEALKYSNIIYVTTSITEDLNITSNRVTIIGKGDSEIVIKGKLRIIDSKVDLKRLHIYGKAGISYEESKIYPPESCPSTAKAGTNGDTACVIINSIVSFKYVTIKGGKGGKGQIFWECDPEVSSESEGCYLCRAGSNGIDAPAIFAKNNSVIDTFRVNCGKIVLDNSNIIEGSDYIRRSQLSNYHPNTPIFNINGKNILFKKGIKGILRVYNIKGELILKEKIEGSLKKALILPTGYFILSFEGEKNKIKSAFVSIR